MHYTLTRYKRKINPLSSASSSRYVQRGKKKIEKAAQVCHCAILQPTRKMEMQKSYQELYPAPEQSLYTSDIQRS